jgi:hypothetical protein
VLYSWRVRSPVAIPIFGFLIRSIVGFDFSKKKKRNPKLRDWDCLFVCDLTSL